MTDQADLLPPEADAKEPKRGKTKPKQEVAVAAPAAVPAPAAGEGSALLTVLQKVISDPTLPMERVKQAMDFYKEMDAFQAKKAFDAAMADAKAKFTPIVKKHSVEYGEGTKKTTFKHEDLADIAAVVDPILGEHGLSYRYRGTSNPNEPIQVTCIVTHRQGYSEETTLSAGADGSGGKNSIQAIGSTLTYLQRYSLRLALGLSVGRDDDGKKADLALITAEQVETLQGLIVDANADIRKFLEWLKIEKLEELPAGRFKDAVDKLEAKRKKAQS